MFALANRIETNTVNSEISKRRTFAIIAHPDAGKTTLTEKFLLYGGAIQLAGSVTARKEQRATASDWMELEKQRGISISSTLLQFDYGPYRINLLDTPGHKDFSEDTYRVLMAVDAVIMVMDGGKGIESQTRKLFEICHRRKIPTFTFVNKMDRPSLSPLELIDQLENVLKIDAYPVNWPLGSGKDFKGVYDRVNKEAHMFERVPGGAYRPPVSVSDFSDPFVKSKMDEDSYNQAAEELDLLSGAHVDFDMQDVIDGNTTPVFFGSAVNNFGVELLLKGFLKYSQGPTPRKSNGEIMPVDHDKFSGFVFKMQTNMDPMHRDRIAFIRVCSGKFTRDLQVTNVRTGDKVRLGSTHKLFGQNREVVEDAYAGDILGVVVKTDFRVGDTVTEDKNIVYNEIPKFAPECFGYLNNPEPGKYKAYRKGIEQLLAEDIVQVFQLKEPWKSDPLLGAVGPLQFEVLQYRLEGEYGSKSTLTPAPWKLLRWIQTDLDDDALKLKAPSGGAFAVDEQGRRVLIFGSEWSMNYYKDKNPDILLFDSPNLLPAVS